MGFRVLLKTRMSFTLQYPTGRQNAVTFTVNGDTVTITDDRRRCVTRTTAGDIYRSFINAGYVAA